MQQKGLKLTAKKEKKLYTFVFKIKILKLKFQVFFFHLPISQSH